MGRRIVALADLMGVDYAPFDDDVFDVTDSDEDLDEDESSPALPPIPRP